MVRAFPLRDFSAGHAGRAAHSEQARAPSFSRDDVEQARLSGYEAGYKAGWDDAVRAEREDQARIDAEFSRNLQEMGFTFQEARAHVMNALEPLLAGMVEKVLPDLVTQTLGQSIVEELLHLASDVTDAPIDVVVNPSCRAVLEPMIKSATSVPFSLIEEPSLADGQVYLRAGQRERHLDFAGAVDRIGKSISDFFSLNEKVFQNG